MKSSRGHEGTAVTQQKKTTTAKEVGEGEPQEKDTYFVSIRIKFEKKIQQNQTTFCLETQTFGINIKTKRENHPYS